MPENTGVSANLHAREGAEQTSRQEPTSFGVAPLTPEMEALFERARSTCRFLPGSQPFLEMTIEQVVGLYRKIKTLDDGTGEGAAMVPWHHERMWRKSLTDQMNIILRAIKEASSVKGLKDVFIEDVVHIIDKYVEDPETMRRIAEDLDELAEKKYGETD